MAINTAISMAWLIIARRRQRCDSTSTAIVTAGNPIDRLADFLVALGLLGRLDLVDIDAHRILVKREKHCQTLFELAAQYARRNVLVLHGLLVERMHKRFNASDAQLYLTQALAVVPLVAQPAVNRLLDLAACAAVLLRKLARGRACYSLRRDLFIALAIVVHRSSLSGASLRAV